MTSSLLSNFVSALEAKFSDENVTMPLSTWVSKHTRLRRKPFTYEGYEFQVQILDDMHPDLSVIKPSQVGLSEVQIRKFLAILKRNTGMTGIFTLPNEAMFKRLSQTRVKPLIEQEPIFNTGDTSKMVRSVGLYQIDDSFAYFTGMTEGAATSIPADLLCHDEIDLSDQATVGLYQSRLQASKFRITQRFGTPTLVGYGIHKAFEDSDQHYYLCRCEGCGHWNDPTFDPRFLHLDGLPDSFDSLADLEADDVAKLDLANAYWRCERCHEPLDTGNPALREWVPKHPTRKGRGYRVRPTATRFITIDYVFKQLLTQKQLNNLKGFWNTVIGEPYTDSNARLAEHEIRAVMKGNLLSQIPSTAPVYVGIDVGASCHVVLGTPTPEGLLVFKWMVVPAERLLDTIEEIEASYNLIGGAMDRHPYTPTANNVRDKTYRKIMPVEYRGHANVQFHKDEVGETDYVQANRTGLIDDVVSAIRRKKMTFVEYRQYESSVVDHLQDMVRIELPDEPARWDKVTGQDHFFHALAFLQVATKISTLMFLQGVNNHGVMAGAVGVTPLHHSASPLGVKGRQRATISGRT